MMAGTASLRTIPQPPRRMKRLVDGQWVQPCRWCDEPIWRPDGTSDRRRLWHPDCVEDYLALSSQQGLLAATEKRDGGRCANCDVVPLCLIGRHRAARLLRQQLTIRAEVLRCLDIRFIWNDPWKDVQLWPAVIDDDWEADHIAPLWAGGEHSMENVQTLCRACHAAKTAYEAGIRARLRRGGAVESQLDLEVAW